MKKNINMLLCLTGILLLVSSILIYLQYKSVKPLQIVLNAVGATCIAFGVSNLYSIFMKDWKKSKEYNIKKNDERNIILRGKSSYMSLIITMFLIGVIGVISFALNYLISSLMCIGLLIFQPILMFILVRYYSKKI